MAGDPPFGGDDLFDEPLFASDEPTDPGVKRPDDVLKSRLDEAEADRALLEAEAARLRADIEELEADNRRLASDLGETRSERERLDREVQRLRGELAATRAALPEIEELRERLRDLTDEYDGRVSALKGLLPYAARLASNAPGPAARPGASPGPAMQPGASPGPEVPSEPGDPSGLEAEDDLGRIESRGGWKPEEESGFPAPEPGQDGS